MESITKREKTRKVRLTQLARTLGSCAGPDVYFAQNESLQQLNLPLSESEGYLCIAPEQIFTLTHMENHNVLMHRSWS